LTLGATNTFGATSGSGTGGSFTMAGGTLNINSNRAVGNANNTFIFQSGTIDNTSAGAVTMSTGAITLQSDLVFTGTNDLSMGGATGPISLGIAADTARTVTVGAKTLTLAGAISDATGATATTLNKQGAGTLVLTRQNLFTGGVNINVGTVRVSGSGTTALGTGPVTIGSVGNSAVLDLNGVVESVTSLATAGVAADQTVGNSSTTLNAGLTFSGAAITSYAGRIVDTIGAGTFKTAVTVNNAAAVVTLSGSNTYSGGTTVNLGTLVAAGGDALGTGPLTVNDTATATVQAGLPKALTVASVTTAGSGQLDITDNSMVIRGSTLAAVQAEVVKAFNAGHWNGAGGITSSNAAANASGTTAVGIGSNGTLNKTTFKGVDNLTATDVLVKYTYYGDADLSGATTLDDFTLFLGGYQNGGTVWSQGDFDYSGAVTLEDFTLFLKGYQQQGAQLSELEGLINTMPMSDSERSAMLAAVQAVPEPGAVAAVFACAAAAFARRRRRNCAIR
jgi:autotransporter-associated beta strand protein